MREFYDYLPDWLPGGGILPRSREEGTRPILSGLLVTVSGIGVAWLAGIHWSPAEVSAGDLLVWSLGLGILGTSPVPRSQTETEEASLATEGEDAGLSALHEQIKEAQDGCLRTVDLDAAGDRPGMRALVEDYNRMIQNLRSDFNYVEDCQNKVVAERNKIDALLQSLPGALISVDENLKIDTVNKQAQEMMEAEEEELEGQNLFDLLNLNEGDRSLLRDAFLYKRTVRNQEIQLTIGEELRAITINLSFLTGEDTDMAAVATLQDITEYKHLQDSVYNREKLVAMGQLAAGVAHELNTPLGNILGYSQLMQDSQDDPEKVAQCSSVVVEEAKQCSRIVQDLLNYARKDQCIADTCALNNLVQEVNETFLNCRLRRYNVEANLDLDPDLPEVEGGCGELDIVLTNLMLNAIQALKGRTAPEVNVRTWQETGRTVGLTIEDNGPGVPAEIRSRIFDPFFTTKEVGDGSGLGLSISQALLSKRGGFIVYDSSYTEGARFLIKLPAVKSQLEEE